MIYFSKHRPRGFHHTYIYVDDRRQLLRELERRQQTGHSDATRKPALNREQFTFRRGSSALDRSFALRITLVFLVLILIIMAAFLILIV